MKLLFLGTGTSHGVPVINCDCKVCTSTDPKDKRYRSSVYVTGDKGTEILIDCGQEFRLQAIENKIKKIDAVLLTHAHADHLFGLDDLRSFSCMIHNMPDHPNRPNVIAPPIPIFTTEHSKAIVEQTFSYLFTPVKEGGGHAKIELKTVNDTFYINELKITPVPMMHGHMPTYGWIINNIAYLTDCNYISDDSFEILKRASSQLDYVIIDGLRIKEHSTHFNFMQALAAADRIAPKNVLITHLTHNSSHTEINQFIKDNIESFPNLKKAMAAGGIVEAAYDRLEISST